jgi:cytochrome P450
MLQFTLRALQARQTLEKEQPELAKSSGKDMLSKWTAAKMDSRHIVTHTSVNVGAGSDSTAISLRAIIYFLLRNPEKLQKLIDQIDQADRDGKLSPLISYRESTTHLPYMEAVMKEATRLHPGVGLILEREVPKGGADIAGHHFRAGTIVGINAWVLGHDADVFPDPESFIPERWIDNTPDRLKEMEQSWFIFGAGARTCIGKNISLMEMAKLVPQLLREFTFELTYPEKEWTTTNVWFVIQRGLICNLTPRARKAVA